MNNKDSKSDDKKDKIPPLKPPKGYVGKKSLLDDKTQKPSESEDEYFRRKEEEQLKKFREEQKAQEEAERKERARELHFMKCPKCYGDLEEKLFKKKVKIDRCKDCGGVWLDSGELETLAGHEESFLSGFFQQITGRTKES
ncbi:MAG: hypothetical protein Kow0099_07830 [Candidatus Abyssubacteria bacterium]